MLDLFFFFKSGIFSNIYLFVPICVFLQIAGVLRTLSWDSAKLNWDLTVNLKA